MSSAEQIELLRKSLVSSFKKDELEVVRDIIAQLQDANHYSSEGASKVGSEVHGIIKKYSDAAVYGDLADKGRELMKKLKQFIKPSANTAGGGGGASATSSTTATTTIATATIATVTAAAAAPPAQATKSTPKSSSNSSKPIAKAVPTAPTEPIRQRVVDLMISEFKTAGADPTISSTVALFIEKEVNQKFPSQTNKASYMDKCKTLTSILKINLACIQSLYKEELTYTKLLTMTAAELAPENLKILRKAELDEDCLARDQDYYKVVKKETIEKATGHAAESLIKYYDDEDSEDYGEVDCDDD